MCVSRRLRRQSRKAPGYGASGGRGELGEVRGSGWTLWGSGQPGVESDDVDRGGSHDVAQVGFGQSDVAGSADSGAADGLRDGPLDSGADGVTPFPLLGVLITASLIEDLLVLAGQQGQLAAVS